MKTLRPGDTTTAAGDLWTRSSRCTQNRAHHQHCRGEFKMTCGKGGQNAWSESLVWFSMVQYRWFAEKKSKTLFLEEYQPLKARSDYSCPFLWGVYPAWVWGCCLGETGGFHHCGGHGICDRLGKSQRGELWSISQGRNFDHFLDLQGGGSFFFGIFSMIFRIFFCWGEVFGCFFGWHLWSSQTHTSYKGGFECIVDHKFRNY